MYRLITILFSGALLVLGGMFQTTALASEIEPFALVELFTSES